MIKVIKKTLDVLEYIARQPNTPQKLSKVAREVGITPATCVRVLKMLKDRHYITQTQSRGGYTLGPMSYHISHQNAYFGKIVDIVAPRVTKIAREIEGYITVVSYCRGKRRILADENGNPEIQIQTHLLNQSGGGLCSLGDGADDRESYSAAGSHRDGGRASICRSHR